MSFLWDAIIKPFWFLMLPHPYTRKFDIAGGCHPFQFCLEKQDTVMCEPLSTWLNGLAAGTIPDLSTIMLPVTRRTCAQHYLFQITASHVEWSLRSWYNIWWPIFEGETNSPLALWGRCREWCASAYPCNLVVEANRWTSPFSRLDGDSAGYLSSRLRGMERNRWGKMFWRLLLWQSRPVWMFEPNEGRCTLQHPHVWSPLHVPQSQGKAERGRNFWLREASWTSLIHISGTSGNHIEKLTCPTGWVLESSLYIQPAPSVLWVGTDTYLGPEWLAPSTVNQSLQAQPK